MARQRSLIRKRPVLSRVGLCNTTLYEKIKEGTFPPSIPIGDRAVAWDSFAIDEWIEEKIKNAERAAANNDSSSMYSDGAGNSGKESGDVQSLAVRGGKL